MPYHAAEARADSALAALRGLPSLGPAWSSDLDSLSSTADAKFSELAGSLARYAHVGMPAALDLVRSDQGRLRMDEARSLVGTMETLARQQRETTPPTGKRSATIALVVISLASLVAFPVPSIVVNRAIREDVRLQVRELKSSSANRPRSSARRPARSRNRSRSPTR